MEFSQPYSNQEIIKEIEEAWVILNGKIDKTMGINNIDLALMCLGLNLSSDEIYRVKKDRNLLHKETITLSEFKDIALIKLKSRNIDSDIDSCIKAFKNKKEVFIRSNIQDIINNNAMLEINKRKNASLKSANRLLDMKKINTGGYGFSSLNVSQLNRNSNSNNTDGFNQYRANKSNSTFNVDISNIKNIKQGINFNEGINHGNFPLSTSSTNHINTYDINDYYDNEIDVINFDDVSYFCKKSKIKADKNEIEEIMKNINTVMKIDCNDIKQLYRKTNLI